MILRKFLKPKHCVFHNHTIQIGTLHKYRSVDDPEIEDDEEGIYRYRIEIEPGTIIDPALVSALQPGIPINGKGRPLSVYGRFNIKGGGLSFSHEKGDLYRVNSCSIDVEFEAANRFMFCMSADLDESPFAGKDHSWCFQHAEREEFFNVISQKLWETIPLDSFENIDEFPNIKKSQIIVGYQAKRVDYAPERHESFRVIRPKTAIELEGTLKNVPFIKNDRDIGQQEFRFLFHYFCNGKLLRPKPDYVTLKLDDVPSIISH